MSSHCHSPVIRFGKHKGRHFHEARSDSDLLLWIKCLATSPNPRSSDIGKWYLTRLTEDDPSLPQIHVNPEEQEFRGLIADARERLAKIEATYTEENQAVNLIRCKLFAVLRVSYEQRDDLRIKLEYKRRFLEALLINDREKAEELIAEERRASDENHQSYEEAADEASSNHLLTEAERSELRAIYRRLATLYHPDQYTEDASKQTAYAELMKTINQAKDACAIDVLREIAQDPDQFMATHGCELTRQKSITELDDLRLIYNLLLKKIEESQERLDDLRATSDYELWQACEQDPSFLEAIANDQLQDIEEEIESLNEEYTTLSIKINELLGPNSTCKT